MQRLYKGGAMKTNRLFTSLLVLLLVFFLSGSLAYSSCLEGSTKISPELSCTTMDINAMLQSGDYQRKVDNFIIIEDATSSMRENVDNSSTSKLTISKGLIRCLNNSLPEDFKVNAGMRIFGSHASENGLVYGMSWYSKTGLEEGVQAVRETGNKTDLAAAISDASNDLKQVSGKTAVIIFSDGGTSKDIDPVAAAAAMKEIYGEKICIYTVLLGDNPDGKIIMEQIATQGRCGFATEASNLYMRPLTDCDTVNVGKGMGDFVARVFLEKYQAPPPPKPDLDSDGDGVLDSLDKCPDTPKGIKVDKDGCPIPMKEKITITLLIEFDFDDDEVKSLHYADIEEVANLLKAYPKTNAELEGHTDSIGSEEYNMDLSKRRAESVKNYIAETFGIDATRISTVSYGESQPVATNETAAGRQNNRRVVANIEAVDDN
jgi:OOP family OmpA-OmpF porin